MDSKSPYIIRCNFSVQGSSLSQRGSHYKYTIYILNKCQIDSLHRAKDK